MDKWLELAFETAREAGVAIMRYYTENMAVQYKQDGSPLTLADQAAHCLIADRLLNSGLVVVSEEGEDLHLDAERHWLVDQGRPVLGVVFAPAIDTFYWRAESWVLG